MYKCSKSSKYALKYCQHYRSFSRQFSIFHSFYLDIKHLWVPACFMI